MKKVLAGVGIVLLLIVISGCNVYETLYVKQPQPEADQISDEDIVMENKEAENQSVQEIEELPVVMDELEDANVILVQETDLVKLNPEAQDPDNDALTFSYTNPLDEQGAWQTTYGDAGEYTVTVTASDGSLSASKKALIIVKRKDEAPSIDKATPVQTSLEAEETDTISFSLSASDLNNDELTYAWKLDGKDIGNQDSYQLKTSYDDAGSHTVKVSVSDGMSASDRLWALTVRNVNRKPIVQPLDDITAKETDTIVIELNAMDEDGDALVYSVDGKGFEQQGSVFQWATGYNDAGQYTLIVTVSDGSAETSQEVVVTVDNVNRPPVILDIMQQ